MTVVSPPSDAFARVGTRRPRVRAASDVVRLTRRQLVHMLAAAGVVVSLALAVWWTVLSSSTLPETSPGRGEELELPVVVTPPITVTPQSTLRISP